MLVQLGLRLLGNVHDNFADNFDQLFVHLGYELLVLLLFLLIREDKHFLNGFKQDRVPRFSVKSDAFADHNDLATLRVIRDDDIVIQHFRNAQAVHNISTSFSPIVRKRLSPL
ncbi:hypothetical protein D3C81_1299410 [compost metagenome]